MADRPHRYGKELDELYDAILQLGNRDECYAFFDDICTISELQALSQRLHVARNLLRKKDDLSANQQDTTGASTATISRVNRCVVYGTGGYNLNPGAGWSRGLPVRCALAQACKGGGFCAPFFGRGEHNGKGRISIQCSNKAVLHIGRSAFDIGGGGQRKNAHAHAPGGIPLNRAGRPAVADPLHHVHQQGCTHR